MEDKKVALVTGASRGIGAAIAKRLAAAGIFVVINYRGARERAAAVHAEITAAGGTAALRQGDVADFTACEAMITEIVKTYGRLDILVNNAGITRDNLLLKMSEAEFDEVLRTNLKGAFNTTRFAVRTMLRQKSGRIINIASVVGVTGNAGQANYAASKAGLIGLTKSVAREVAKKGIRVNAVAPGFIATDMTAGLPEAVKTATLVQIPAGAYGTADDVAAAVAFLAAEEAGYITGQVLNVDGGMAM